MTWEHCIY